MKKQNNITPFDVDVSKWYSDLILKSELISYGPIKGTMFLKPYGFKIWKNIEFLLNKEFEKLEIEEVKFPLLLPESFLKKEESHVKGFSPEVFKVTEIGNKKLDQPFIIRPTSETLFGIYFKENINSYSQLPLKLNQWVNVMRWENNTRPFLRNSEFFWQEGHTIHETSLEAKDFAKKIQLLYDNFIRKTLLLSPIVGEKTIIERFAGAKNTYTIETILKDGQSLQTGTTHYLGNSFTKVFDVKVQGANNKIFFPFQTSWGVSIRMIGALIMTHSDDKGLILPSKVAPYHIIIMTLFNEKNESISKVVEKLKNNLNLRIKIDDSNKNISYKLKKWELKGAPIRIVIGPKEIETNNISILLRNEDNKITKKLEEIDNSFIEELLIGYDKKIFDISKKIRESSEIMIKSIEEIYLLNDLRKVGFAYWTENQILEKKIKEKSGITIRCLVSTEKCGNCIHSNSKTNKMAVFARSY